MLQLVRAIVGVIRDVLRLVVSFLRSRPERFALKICFFALGGLHDEYEMAPRPCLIEDWDISRIRCGANNCGAQAEKLTVRWL